MKDVDFITTYGTQYLTFSLFDLQTLKIKAVLWVRIRKIRKFLGHPNPDPSIIKQKKEVKP